MKTMSLLFWMISLVLCSCSGHDCSSCYDQDFYDSHEYYCEQCIERGEL